MTWWDAWVAVVLACLVVNVLVIGDLRRRMRNIELEQRISSQADNPIVWRSRRQTSPHA